MRYSINLMKKWADEISQCLKAISKIINVKVQERESMMMDLLKSESGEVASFLEQPKKYLNFKKIKNKYTLASMNLTREKDLAEFATLIKKEKKQEKRSLAYLMTMKRMVMALSSIQMVS